MNQQLGQFCPRCGSPKGAGVCLHCHPVPDMSRRVISRPRTRNGTEIPPMPDQETMLKMLENQRADRRASDRKARMAFYAFLVVVFSPAIGGIGGGILMQEIGAPFLAWYIFGGAYFAVMVIAWGMHVTAQGELAAKNPPKSFAIRCPHCMVRGGVTLKAQTRRAGIDGRKAIAAVLTGGISLPVAGISVKQKVTRATCSRCGSEWEL